MTRNKNYTQKNTSIAHALNKSKVLLRNIHSQ